MAIPIPSSSTSLALTAAAQAATLNSSTTMMIPSEQSLPVAAANPLDDLDAELAAILPTMPSAAQTSAVAQTALAQSSFAAPAAPFAASYLPPAAFAPPSDFATQSAGSSFSASQSSMNAAAARTFSPFAAEPPAAFDRHPLQHKRPAMSGSNAALAPLSAGLLRSSASSLSIRSTTENSKNASNAALESFSSPSLLTTRARTAAPEMATKPAQSASNSALRTMNFGSLASRTPGKPAAEFKAQAAEFKAQLDQMRDNMFASRKSELDAPAAKTPPRAAETPAESAAASSAPARTLRPAVSLQPAFDDVEAEELTPRAEKIQRLEEQVAALQAIAFRSTAQLNHDSHESLERSTEHTLREMMAHAEASDENGVTGSLKTLSAINPIVWRDLQRDLNDARYNIIANALEALLAPAEDAAAAPEDRG